jgi:hypothetical protein
VIEVSGGGGGGGVSVQRRKNGQTVEFEGGVSGRVQVAGLLPEIKETVL